MLRSGSICWWKSSLQLLATKSSKPGVCQHQGNRCMGIGKLVFTSTWSAFAGKNKTVVLLLFCSYLTATFICISRANSLSALYGITCSLFAAWLWNQQDASCPGTLTWDGLPWLWVSWSWKLPWAGLEPWHQGAKGRGALEELLWVGSTHKICPLLHWQNLCIRKSCSMKGKNSVGRRWVWCSGSRKCCWGQPLPAPDDIGVSSPPYPGRQGGEVGRGSQHCGEGGVHV